MNHRIGDLAGKIWLFLGRHGRSTLEQLKKTVDEPPELVAMAVGWLARENKIIAQKSGSISLTLEEKTIFDRTRKGDSALLADEIVKAGRKLRRPAH